MDNQSSHAGEINLNNAAGAVVAEIETLGPATTAEMPAMLGPGSYTFECHMSGEAVTTSATVQVTGKATQNVPAAVKPVTLTDLTGPNKEYERYAAGQLRTLAGAITKIKTDLQQGRLNAARTDWLAAQLDWEKAGASYDSFGDDGTAVDGLPDGLVNGVNDKDFTGLHRLEYGLWHGQSAATLLPVVNVLARDVTTVQKNLASGDLAGDPANLALRAHEILEDALRDHVSGIDDQGSGDAYAVTYADLQVTRVVLSELAPLINERALTLLPTAQAQLNIPAGGPAGDPGARAVDLDQLGLAGAAAARGRRDRGAARNPLVRTRPARSTAHPVSTGQPANPSRRINQAWDANSARREPGMSVSRRNFLKGAAAGSAGDGAGRRGTDRRGPRGWQHRRAVRHAQLLSVPRLAPGRSADPGAGGEAAVRLLRRLR